MGNQGEVLTKTDISMQESLADHRKQNSSKSLEPSGIHLLRTLKKLKSKAHKD